MDKEEATRILAKELAGKDYINFIFDEKYEEIVRNNNIGISPIWGEKSIINCLHYGNQKPSEESYEKYYTKIARKMGANYIFSRNKGFSYEFFGIPYAIITSDEIPIIKKELYKGDFKIEEALDQLGIFNSVVIFRNYSDNNVNIIRNYFIEGNYINDVRIERLNFLLNLPEIYQNISINCEIIKNLTENQCKLNNEYMIKPVYYAVMDFINTSYLKKSKNFIEYFSNLSDSFKIETIKIIKNIDEKNIDEKINAELFAKGYNVPVQFIQLYKTNQDSFIKYFENSEDDEKDSMIRAIYKLKQEERNSNIETYLSHNHAERLGKVARMDIKEKNEISYKGGTGG